MRAFVLGGGGNLGPLQIGALRALLEQKIYPDMIVGCSVGALNAIQLAQDLSLCGVGKMERLWSCTTTRDIYPGNHVSRLWRILKNQDSLYDNRSFYNYLERNGFEHHKTFGEFTEIPVYITATHLQSGQLRVFGKNPNERILDAAMATTAIPPLHPPWEIDGEQYIDGSTVTPLPLRVAIEAGATEIYALRVEHSISQKRHHGPTPKVNGAAQILEKTIRTMMRLQVEQDLSLINRDSRIKFHQLLLHEPKSLPRIDFSQSKQLIQHGYLLTQAFVGRTLTTERPIRQARSAPLFSKMPTTEAAC